MILSIDDNALVLVVLCSMIGIEELVLGLKNFLDSLMGRRPLNLA